MAEAPNQDDGLPPEDAAPTPTQGHVAGDATPGALDDEPTPRRLRRRPNFRGHIVVDDDEPLPVFDIPAEPPAPLFDPPGSQAPQR